MDCNSGKELLKTFDKLGINLGNCGSNVIEAWFDIDPQITEFLTWLNNNLSAENVIFRDEIEEYEYYVSKDVIPSPEHYPDALFGVSKKYQGIFDVSENEFEIECLEDELNILLEDKNKLDNILQLHENLYKKEKLSLAELEKQKNRSMNELKKAEEECFELSCSLDEINKKLYDQLASCNEKLIEYEYPSTSTYISNTPMHKYYSKYKDIISYFGLLEKREFAGLPKLQSAVTVCSKLDGSVFREKSDDNLRNLKLKLFKSIQNKNDKEAVKKQLQAELDYLKQCNIYEVMNSLRSKQQLEANVETKFETYSIFSLELENLSIEVSEKYINYPSIAIAKQEAKILQGKLTIIKEVENVFLDILSYHTLLYLMLVINNTDISRSDEFFRSVHTYIAHNLKKCEYRIESMDAVIKEHNIYEKIPLKQRSTLLQVLQRLVSEDITNMKFNHQHQCSSANIDESLKFPEHIRLIESNNKLLKSFLTNGPTSEIITFPYKLHEIFNNMDNILNTKNDMVSTTVAICHNAEKKLSENVWFKYKRQLWINFLMRPQKVLACIEKIENEIKKLRSQEI